MAYSYRSKRSVKRYAQKSKRNLILTLILVGFLMYAAIFWILPNLVNGIATIKGILGPKNKNSPSQSLDEAISPPVLTIPFEATNSSSIDIAGYSTPGTEVEIYLDEELKKTTDVKEDGTFTFKNIGLSLGTNNIYGKTRNGDKLSLPSKQFRINFDNEKPNLEVFDPVDGKSIQVERKLKISGQTEPGAKVFINDTQVIVDKEGKFSKELILNDGDNNFNIKAIDSASNATEVERRIFFTP